MTLRVVALAVSLLLCSSSASAQLVTRVVDGDTIHVEGVGSVRLIGVDTPEAVDPRKPVEFFARESSEFTRRMALGKIVRLESDVQQKDKYNRTLAYVYLPDGSFLNAEIVRQGYSHAYTVFPFKYLDAFRTYERQAREQERGLWASQQTGGAVPLVAAPVVADGSETVFVTKSGDKYHAAGCRFLAKSQIPVALKNVGNRAACSVCGPPVLETVPKPSSSGSTADAPRPPPRSATSTRCQATTKSGKQCSRQAQPGRNYCWQH